MEYESRCSLEIMEYDWTNSSGVIGRSTWSLALVLYAGGVLEYLPLAMSFIRLAKICGEEMSCWRKGGSDRGNV